MSGGQYAARGIVDASSRGLSAASEGGRRAVEFGRKSAADLLSVSQGVLASGLAVDLNAMLAKVSAGPATIYDKAMDAEYLATSIGGGNHRMFDGGHTLAGAFEAVRGASAEDTILQEGFGYMQALFRDLTTPKGLPLANWDRGTYGEVSGYLQSQFSIPKGWFYDINSFDAAEVLGAGVGVGGGVLLLEPWGVGAVRTARRRHGPHGSPQREPAALDRYRCGPGSGVPVGAARRQDRRRR